MSSESRIWEIRPFGSMRGGRELVIGLCAFQPILSRLLYGAEGEGKVHRAFFGLGRMYWDLELCPGTAFGVLVFSRRRRRSPLSLRRPATVCQPFGLKNTGPAIQTLAQSSVGPLKA